jgi:hypothetical protein
MALDTKAGLLKKRARIECVTGKGWRDAAGLGMIAGL